MVLVPGTGRIAAVHIFKGADQSYSNEAMNEVDLSAEGYPRYTVYEITEKSKRYMNTSAVPTFTCSPGTIPAISDIEYCGGRVIFATPAGAGDTIVCATGKYQLGAEFMGCLNFNVNRGWKTEDYIHIGDTNPSTALIHKRWEVTTEAHWMNTMATYTSSGGVAHSHFTLTHMPGGESGNDVTIELIDPSGLNATIDIAVTGKNIAVTLASTADPALTTTALQLVTALNASDAVRGLGVVAQVKAGETGAGIVAAITPHEHLAGGASPADYSSETDKVALVCYLNETGDQRHEGYAIIQNFDPKIDPGTLIKTSLTFKSYGPTGLYYRKS